jgi:hypothetical protein
MPTAASPRHPWKALAVVLLVLAVVHGARAHVGLHGHDLADVHVVHADHDCDRVDIRLDDDGPDDDAVFDVIDDGAWS